MMLSTNLIIGILQLPKKVLKQGQPLTYCDGASVTIH